MAGLIILDFDGTMTDAEAEGAPFRGGYLEDVAALCGLDFPAVDALAQGFEAEVAATPEKYGWIYEGQIVAPASVDPYLRIMPVARKIMDHTGSFLNETDRTRLLDAILYKYNYTKTKDVPREGAAEVLRGLADEAVYIVTNSHTDAVQQKVRAMGGLEWLVDRVYGRAKKYVIDDTFDAVPQSLELPGLDRPVLLRRRLYFEVIDQRRQQAGVEWSEVLVVGDIFELDLALPLACGAHVALMANDFTPIWETEWLTAHPRGSVISSVDQIPKLLAGVTGKSA